MSFDGIKNHFKQLEKMELKEHFFDERCSEKNVDSEISVRLETAEQFFNTYDPSPLEERSLNPGIEEYLISRLSNLPEKFGLRVHLVFSCELSDVLKSKIKVAYANHFKIRAAERMIENHREHVRWIRLLFFGVLFLAFCLVSSHILKVQGDLHPFLTVLSESLSIIGWVAVWEPACYLLFGWRENAGLLRDCMLLHTADVDVCQDSSDPLS